MKFEPYNGAPNKSTWQVKLILTNDASAYNDLGFCCDAEGCKELWEEWYDESNKIDDINAVSWDYIYTLAEEAQNE